LKIKWTKVLINILFSLLLWFPGIIHAMIVDGLTFGLACVMCFLPPVGLWLMTSNCGKDVFISMVLWLTIFGGIWYAFWRADKIEPGKRGSPNLKKKTVTVK
jgi:uncharacterized membrane protein YqaE (UPF0057 family)